MRDMFRCSAVARRLYDILSNDPRVANAGVTFPSRPEMFAFRGYFNQNSSLVAVSVSVPADAMGNRSMDLQDGSLPSTYELALFDSNEHLVYDSDAGYDDVCRFYSVEELVTELVRLANYNGPVQYDGNDSEESDDESDGEEGPDDDDDNEPENESDGEEGPEGPEYVECAIGPGE